MSQVLRAVPLSFQIAESEGPGGRFIVEDHDGLRLLLSPDGTMQGSVDLSEPARAQLAYLQALVASLAFPVAPHRILVVGLGAGTFPMALRRLLPRAHVTVVEIDPGVVELARAHFRFVEDDHLSVRLQDAQAFLEEDETCWDLVVLDAYLADIVPEHLATLEWFELVRARLTGKGVVASNLWSAESNPRFLPTVRLLLQVFGELFLLPCGEDSNTIVVGRVDNTEPVPPDVLLQRLASLESPALVPSLAYDALRDLRHVRRRRSDG